jgi:hypothetical protein
MDHQKGFMKKTEYYCQHPNHENYLKTFLKIGNQQRAWPFFHGRPIFFITIFMICWNEKLRIAGPPRGPMTAATTPQETDEPSGRP